MALKARYRSAGEGHSPHRERVAVSLLFAIMGLSLGEWSARIPDIRRALHLGDAGWGLSGTASTLGELVALGLTVAFVSRYSARLAVFLSAAVMLTAIPTAAATGVLPIFLATFFIFGFALSSLNAPMNAQAVEVERRYQRPILASFHACFSISMLAGGVLGTVAAAGDLPPVWQFAGCSAVLAVPLVLTRPWLPQDEPPAPAATSRSLRERLSRQILLLAAIAFLASLAESAARQWSAIYVADTLHAGRVAGAATFTCLSVADALSRLVGDRIAARLGVVRFLSASAVVAAAGLALALAAGTTAASLVGFGVLGLGVGCAVPTVISLAGNQPGLRPGEGISIVVAGQWPAFFLAPPLIGVLAGLVGLRLALLTIVLSTLLLALITVRINAPARHQPPPSGQAPSPLVSIADSPDETVSHRD